MIFWLIDESLLDVCCSERLEVSLNIDTLPGVVAGKYFCFFVDGLEHNKKEWKEHDEKDDTLFTQAKKDSSSNQS